MNVHAPTIGIADVSGKCIAFNWHCLLESPDTYRASAMLEGKELGEALKRAMKLKKVTQPVVAEEFDVSQPSVSEWTRYGRIGKKHLVHLVEYFSTHVGPEHWGLPPTWSATAAHAEWPLRRWTPQQWAAIDPLDRAVLEDAAMVKLRELGAERGESPPIGERPAGDKQPALSLRAQRLAAMYDSIADPKSSQAAYTGVVSVLEALGGSAGSQPKSASRQPKSSARGKRS